MVVDDDDDLALHLFESLHNSDRLDPVLHKATGGNVPKNEAQTLPLAPMFKKDVQRLRLALSKGPTTVLTTLPSPLPCKFLSANGKKRPVSETLFPFSHISRSSKTDRNQTILNIETFDSAKGGEHLQQLERIIKALPDTRQSTAFRAFYNRQYRQSFVTVR